jgi:hypothetical protein
MELGGWPVRIDHDNVDGNRAVGTLRKTLQVVMFMICSNVS